MRRYIKDRIRELMQSVIMGMEEIPRVTPAEAVELLTEVQSAVVSIGNIIEEKEEESRDQLIPYLEVLAEMAYQLAMDILEDRGYLLRCQDFLDKGRQIEQLLEQELKVVYEVVFLPYKSSMWDCMESVYRAAKQQDDCHVSVIPVPYYHLSGEGKILETIYEGAALSPEIEITNFEEYSIEEVCPDVIFIHNPYDEYNYVTQLPSRYFSRELIKYTNHLVYLPYKVCRGIVSDIYCALPGPRYAWRVFVQSERVRETYIKYNQSEKIVALGSPKVDKVILSEKYRPEFPEAWRQAVQGRKVFLLNTHLNNIINNAEDMIEKLQKVFALFRNQKDIALLWRPHPLSIQTAKSMNPEILPAYMALVEEVKKMENGIYDESPDMYAAISLSDAYLGDGSSLVALYGATGRPLMILQLMKEADDLRKRNGESLRMAAATIKEDSIYFYGRDTRGIYRYNTTQKQTEYLGSLKDELQDDMGMVEYMHYDKNKLFLSGGKDRECHVVYHLKDGRNNKIGKDSCNRLKQEIKGWFHYGERLYVVYSDFYSFGYIDFELEKYVSLIPRLQQELERLGLQERSIRIIDVAQGKKELVLLMGNHTIIFYHTETMRMKKLSIDTQMGEVLKVAAEGQYLYFLNRQMEVYRYTTEGEYLEKWKVVDDSEVADSIGRMLVRDGQVWMLPLREGGFYCADFGNHQVNRIDYSKELSFDYDLFTSINNFCCMDMTEHELILYPRAANRLIKMDLTSHTLEEQIVKKPESMSEKELAETILEQGGCVDWFQSVYYERSCSIQEFIHRVKTGNDTKKEKRKQEFASVFANTQGTCGTEIWNYIRENI